MNIFTKKMVLYANRLKMGEGGCEVWVTVLRQLLGNKRADRFENRENTHRLIIISCSNFYFQADKRVRGFYVKSWNGLTVRADILSDRRCARLRIYRKPRPPSSLLPRRKVRVLRSRHAAVYFREQIVRGA